MKISRREFVEWSAAVGAVAAMGLVRTGAGERGGEFDSGGGSGARDPGGMRGECACAAQRCGL